MDFGAEPPFAQPGAGLRQAARSARREPFSFLMAVPGPAFFCFSKRNPRGSPLCGGPGTGLSVVVHTCRPAGRSAQPSIVVNNLPGAAAAHLTRRLRLSVLLKAEPEAGSGSKFGP